MKILTYAALREFVLELIKEQKGKYQGSLDEYLRSLWVLANVHQSQQPTLSLIGVLLAESFSTQPAPFDERWLEDYTQSASELVNDYDRWEKGESQLELEDFEFFKITILFQIADLRRMAENGTINNPLRYFGIDSPTDHRWYNFSPFSFLERGTSLYEGASDPDEVSTDWTTLGWLLMYGAFYE